MFYEPQIVIEIAFDASAGWVVDRMWKVGHHGLMGIQDRDYMKQPSDGRFERGASADSKVEEFLSGFLRRHPRFFLYAGAGIGALIAIGLVIAWFSGGR